MFWMSLSPWLSSSALSTTSTGAGVSEAERSARRVPTVITTSVDASAISPSRGCCAIAGAVAAIAIVAIEAQPSSVRRERIFLMRSLSFFLP